MDKMHLPEGFVKFKEINMQTDKKLALLVNGLAVLIMVVMVVLGVVFAPRIWDKTIILQIFLLLPALICYMFFHELIHGLFFWIFSKQKPRYGFTGLYAYARSEAFYPKLQYLIIGLSPVVVFLIVFLLLNIFLPSSWFWFAYVLQIFNISGAAGDLYVTLLLAKLPKDILIFDFGVGMEFYAKSQPEKILLADISLVGEAQEPQWDVEKDSLVATESIQKERQA
jgi:hypothetical protein